jgi:O-antigen ligase
MDDLHIKAPLKGTLPFLPLIAATPVVFAVMTLPSLSAYWSGSDFFRFFSFPVTLIELIVVILAVTRGVSYMAPLAAETLWVKAALALVGLVAVGTAAFVATEMVSAVVRTFAWAVHLLFGLTLAGVAQKFWTGREREVWLWILWGLLAYLAILILFVATLPDPTHYDWWHFSVSVLAVRQLGFYSAAGFSVAIGLAVFANSRKSRWLLVAAAAAMIALSFWSGTRSSILSSVAAVIVGAAVCREMRTLRSLALASLALIGGMALSVVYVAPEPDMGLKRIFVSVTSGDSKEKYTSGRRMMWLGTAQAIARRPVFGYGESQFKTNSPPSFGGVNHPHNAILQFLYQWGLVGGGSFLALMAMLYFRLIRSVRAEPKTVFPAFILVSNMFAMAQIEGALYHPYPVMMAVFGLAMGLAFGSLKWGT